ncbi:glycoside hydrolase [Halosquirtibacter xylanolyticus]|uniref:sialidase family protein n=1 Tax=Halosquirtibacter xylanolyticus TaxID=3374599 RepID=UPI00374A81FC|nr:glycoside hydrolase [Prolixibacteraceae bacterium]
MRRSVFMILVVSMICGIILDVVAQNNKELSFTNLFDASNDAGVSCYRIPSLVTAPNGDLLAAIDQRVPSCGDLKWSRDINIVLRRSKDNGKTWCNMEMVIDHPFGQSASDPSMIVDRERGVVFLFYNYMDLDKEKDIYYLHVMKSVDNGKTWSSPMDITDQITKPEWKTDFKFITSGRGAQTHKGWLIHTIVNLRNGLHVFGSKDHGDSWFLIDEPIIPGDESKIIELPNRQWMINSRVNNPRGKRFSHTSKSNGKTWSTKVEMSLNDPGCNGTILTYSSKKSGDDKNRLIFVNANSSKKRENLCARISYDNGKTWSSSKVIYAGASAYSSITKMNNGSVGVFFEKDGYKKNSFTSFTIGWLTDGGDH